MSEAPGSHWVSVGVYKNGVLIGAGPTTSFFVNRGGRIGAWRH